MYVMVHFMRMVLSSVCLVLVFYELMLGISLTTFIAIDMQGWFFFEWLGNKKEYKPVQHDVILCDVIPFLSQIILFYKISI
jgi:uncharacterized protein with PQ loop repeat